jgi:hypothetical protein
VKDIANTHRLLGEPFLLTGRLTYPWTSSKNVAKYTFEQIMVKLRTKCRLCWIRSILIWVSTHTHTITTALE